MASPIPKPNILKENADEYLRKHRIIELMEDLCSDICFEQPKNIEEFLIERLKLKQKQGFKTGIFAKEEVSNIFSLFDLKRDGFIDKTRCKEALKTMANNEFEFEQVDVAAIPDKVDEKTFVSLCEKVLGYKP
jgi:Glu-tRNA(Gln) amidotransferase subunit E-like FAD-binding protein